METYMKNHSSTALNLSEIVLGLRKLQRAEAQKSGQSTPDIVDSLTQRDMQTLRVLSRLTIDENNPDGVSLKLIQESLNINKASASVIVSHLVDKGLVTSRDNPKNRRSKLIKLTALGQENIHRILEKCNELLTGLMQDLPKNDIDTFIRVTAQVHRNIYTALTQLSSSNNQIDE